jgi:hypothetical protein
VTVDLRSQLTDDASNDLLAEVQLLFKGKIVSQRGSNFCDCTALCSLNVFRRSRCRGWIANKLSSFENVANFDAQMV